MSLTLRRLSINASFNKSSPTIFFMLLILITILFIQFFDNKKIRNLLKFLRCQVIRTVSWLVLD